MSGDNECWAARRELWPLEGEEDLRPRVLRARGGPARTHVADCGACREWLRADLRVGRRLRRLDTEDPAPHRLRRRIEAGLGEGAGGEAPPWKASGTPAGRRTRSGWIRLAAAAVLVLALAAGWTEHRASASSGTGALPAAMARDYVQRVEEEVRLSVTDPEAIRAFFAEHYGTPLDPRVSPEAEIQGAMICWLRKRATAMVMYRIGGHPVAHYRTPLQGSEDEDAVLRSEELAGVRLAHWSSGGELHAVVADLPAGELSALARARFGAGSR